MDVGEEDMSREVFLFDLNWGRFSSTGEVFLNWGRFMNSNSEVTDTVDLPFDLAWLALDRGETNVTLIGIFLLAFFLLTLGQISPWSAFFSKDKFTIEMRRREFHMCAARRPASDWLLWRVWWWAPRTLNCTIRQHAVANCSIRQHIIVDSSIRQHAVVHRGIL